VQRWCTTIEHHSTVQSSTVRVQSSKCVGELQYSTVVCSTSASAVALAESGRVQGCMGRRGLCVPRSLGRAGRAQTRRGGTRSAPQTCPGQRTPPAHAPHPAQHQQKITKAGKHRWCSTFFFSFPSQAVPTSLYRRHYHCLAVTVPLSLNSFSHHEPSARVEQRAEVDAHPVPRPTRLHLGQPGPPHAYPWCTRRYTGRRGRSPHALGRAGHSGGLGGAGGAEELKVKVVLLAEGAWGLLAGAPGVTGAVGTAGLGGAGASFLPGAASTRSSIIFCTTLGASWELPLVGVHGTSSQALTNDLFFFFISLECPYSDFTISLVPPLSQGCVQLLHGTFTLQISFHYSTLCVSTVPLMPPLPQRCPCAGWLRPAPPPEPAGAQGTAHEPGDSALCSTGARPLKH